jgi:conjugal transfer pilus assembly protein TraA
MHAMTYETRGYMVSLSERQKKLVLAVSFFAISMLLMVVAAQAGTTGTEFKELYDMFIGWAKGYLGKIFAILSFLIGCGFAAARQSPMPAVFGLIMAMIIGFGPGLIEKLLTAVI